MHATAWARAKTTSATSFRNSIGHIPSSRRTRRRGYCRKLGNSESSLLLLRDEVPAAANAGV
jgi:hypothetical protein